MVTTLTMTEHPYGTSTQTHVWYGSALYIFEGSMAQAHQCGGLLAQVPIPVYGSAVADMPARAASLVWLKETPYLFPGSLTAASKRGKMYKGIRRRESSTQLYYRRLEAAGFGEQYGEGIGGKERTR